MCAIARALCSKYILQCKKEKEEREAGWLQAESISARGGAGDCAARVAWQRRYR
jgi:hypothetical protein